MNQRKWFVMERTHDERKGIDVSEMNGHVSDKFCRYTTWHIMENMMRGSGRESKKYRKTSSAMTT